MDDHDFIIFKKEFPDKGQCLNSKLAFPFEYFIFINDYQKQVKDLKKEDFFSDFKN